MLCYHATGIVKNDLPFAEILATLQTFPFKISLKISVLIETSA
jgi:hypothetical protein